MSDKKNWIEIFLMPLVVAGVGILGTYLITHQQEVNARAKADSDRQIKILEIFAEKITSPNKKEQIQALKFLQAVDDNLAAKLATAVAETEPEDSEVKYAATKVADVAKARIELRPRVYVHVEGESEETAAQSLERLAAKTNWIIPGIQKVGAKSPDNSQLRYFRESEKATAEEIQNFAKEQNIDLSLKYIPGYEESQSIQPMHFEIWFAPGEPEMNQ